MKKLSVLLIMVIVATKTAFALRLGMEFSVSEELALGLNLKLTEKFELKPQLGFAFAEDDNKFILNVDGNFYLPQMQNLQHYAGPGISFSAYSDDVFFKINGHYGLRYDFNDIISTFGEVGLGITFNPFIMTTFKGGLGLTFYFPGIR